jgi:Tfp pilus assembly protein PilZ
MLGREQREWIRVPVDLMAKCRAVNGAARYDAVRIVDMHHKGCCLQAAVFFRKGTEVRVILDLPFEGALSMTAEVAWHMPVDTNDEYRMGLKFIIDTPAAEDICMKIYNYCSLRHPK